MIVDIPPFLRLTARQIKYSYVLKTGYVSCYNYLMKIENISAILIWSENYRKLADWYREKLDLKTLEELNHPQDTGVGFQVGNVYLWIGQHSKVKGKNKDIHRHMFNLVVPSVTQAYNELENRGVKFLARPFKAPTFDKYFATFYDLDNNLVQLIGNK